jgi:ABC-2 type transport system permease protein
MTKTLLPVGCEARGVQLMFHVICIFTVIFGINVIFNEFYFSNDIEFLLPWPLRAYQIVASKFTAAYYNENMMQFVLVLACIIGFGTGSGMGISHWLLSIIGIITLPLIPLCYCAILSMLIMAFTHFIKNKDIIQRLSVTLLFVMVVAFVASIGFLQNMDIDTYVAALASGNQRFFNVMNIIFPNVPLFVKTFHQGSIVALLEYILINAAFVAVMIFLSEHLYFRGVIGLTSSDTGKTGQNASRVISRSKQHSAFFAYFMKDVRILVRTPVFFTNCIAINFLWPIFAYAMIKIQSYEISIPQLRQLYAQRDLRIQLFFLLCVVGISVIVAALNSLSANAISREGKHFSFMKYIPVPYFTQWNVKALIGIIFPFMGVNIYLIPVYIILRIPFLHALFYVVLSLMSICFISYMGIYIDSIQPKLIWDDEMSALRENYNTFFAMAIAIAFACIVCIGGFFLFCNTTISIGFVWILLVFILAAANLIVLLLTLRSGVRNLEEQEEA